MKAIKVFEKFTEDSDPIKDMGIGDSLQNAVYKMRNYAEKNNFQFFEGGRSGKTPTIIIPIEPYHDTYNNWPDMDHSVYVTKIGYTISYKKESWEDTPFQLRKIWIGYKMDVDAFLEIIDKTQVSYSTKKNMERSIIKKQIAAGELSEVRINQQLQQRFTTPEEAIQRMDLNISKLKKL